jgi:ATP-dependent DNA helicase RecG
LENTELLVDPEQITALIAIGMGETLHWFPEEVSLSSLAETLVGMANTVGGTVILGVSPRGGELVGVKNPQAAFDRVLHSAILVDPTLVLPLPRLVEIKDAILGRTVRLVVISVPAGLPYVYCFEGRYLGRQGNQTNPLSARELYQLLSQRGGVQFESRVVPDACLDDLDKEQVIFYAQSAGNLPSGDLGKAHEFLVQRGCMKQVEGELKLTYAALLLFGRFPQQWLPNATLLAGRFPGRVLSGEYIKKDITGSLPKQLQQAEAFIRTNLRTTVRLVGLHHQEILEYPFEAVRELIVNAVAHRDYNLQGDNIHINIYSDRLEITSPGTLPGPVTLKNLLDARFARNAVISQVLSDLGYVERLGYGLNRVVETARSAGLLPPQFEETAGTFRVTLFASLVGSKDGGNFPDLSLYEALDLNPRQQLALAQLSQHARISSHDFQELCPDVHAETLRRDLADLVRRGVLIKVGDKKSTYYILKRI